MTEASFASDEELFRWLRYNLHEAALEATLPARRTRLAQEVQETFEILAGRVYDRPDQWGLSSIPQAWRDEVAYDMLLALLEQASGRDIKPDVTEWFAREVKYRFQALTEKFATPAPEETEGGR